jgi:Tfp pilus assembly protein PilV
MIIIAMTLLMAVSLHAQQPANRQQAMQRIEQQVRHYSEVFELNEEQAQQFATLYKAYNKQMRAIHDQYWHERTAEGTTLTDEQIEQRIFDNFEQSRAILDTREQYYKEFRKVLSSSQINQIFEDEKARRA